LLPGIAWAHNGTIYSAPGVTTAPTLDGTITAAEWSNAPSYNLLFGNHPATVRFVHTATDLYVGVVVQDTAVGTSPRLTVLFDNTHNGQSDSSDDAWAATLGKPAEDLFNGDGYLDDTDFTGGTNDTTASVAASGGAVTFEIKHPLCTNDVGHDICGSQAGLWLGIDFQYQPDPANSQEADSYPGASAFDQSDWADLGIGPAAQWATPQPGATIGGSVQAQVLTTSDVDHVVYEYFDGQTERTYQIGTATPDAEGRATITFDTTRFPDSSDATLYATPYNAAGQAGIKVGIDINLANDQSVGQGLGTVHGSLDNDFVFVIQMWPNALVTGTVQTPGNTAVSWSTTTDSDGKAAIAPAGRWDLVPGTVITANDGRGQKTLTLVSITITSANTTTNVVSGTAPPGAPVRVVLFTSNGTQLEEQDGTAGSGEIGGGQWSVTFNTQLAAPQHLLADTNSGDNDGDRSRADFDIQATQSDTYAISINGTGTAQAGAGSVPLTGPNALPINVITGAPGGPSGSGLGGIGLGGIGLGGIGLGGITINDIGLGGIGLGGIGLGGIGLGGIGLTSLNLQQNGLGGVPLSTIPLKAPDTWQAHLDATTQFRSDPPQSVTLAQVLGTPVVQGVRLADLDLSGSGLGGIGLGGIGLGGIGLGGIGLGGIADGAGGYYGGSQTASNLAGWCDYINRQPGFTCTDPSSLNGKTVMDIALQGVGLGGIPFEKIGLGGIDLTGTGLGGIPVGVGLGGIGLGGIELGGTGLGGIGLGGINMAANGLGGIVLGSLPNKSAILNCPTGAFTCADTATLAQAAAAGAFKTNATVQDIGYYCTPTGLSATAAWCRNGDHAILMQDFVKGLPSTVTIADLLAALLPKAAYDWEKLPLTKVPLQDYSSDGGLVTYTVPFTITGVGDPRTANVEVTLPAGARYVAGSASTAPDNVLRLADPQVDGSTLTWFASVPVNTQETLTFKAKPGLSLGTESATARLLTPSSRGFVQAAAAPNPAATSITQTFPADTTAASAQAVSPDTLYLGYTPNGTNRDYFSLPLPAAGTQVTVHLGHLSVDEDLVVFGPTVAPLRVPKPGTQPTVAPLVDPSLQQRNQSIQPEALNDVPQAPPPGQSVVGVSDNRGLADEEVTFIVPEHSPGATATIQVTSYDGSYSNNPWTLRVEESPAIPLPTTCTSTPLVGGGVTKSLPTSVGGSTLYLFNSKRFGDIYGLTAENNVMTKLTGLAGRTDAAGGTVVPIDAVSTISNALNTWYGNQCSPGASNDVVRAIGKYLDTLPTTYKYVVLVGGYDVVPPGLVLDNTSYVNERDYASTFYGATNNQFLSAYALGYLPTDDPYGDTSYPGTGAYVPDVAVGRLVETPNQIMGQIDKYTSPAVNGAINPTTALVTGYDFLSDGAQQVAAALQPKVPAPAQLINDSWSRLQLLSALFPTTGAAPQIDVVNAHYDHRHALPASENASGTATPDLLGTNDVAASANRLVITLGCHSGVPVSDNLFASGLSTDWAETYLGQGAIDYIANTGFGLGETAGVAYSEQLQVLLAQRLDGSMTVGQALAFAKQEYAGSVPTTSGYQLKVLDEAELYGLPMYSLGTGSTAAPPDPKPVVTDAATGLPATTFSISPTYAINTVTGRGSYYTVAGSAAYEDRRPIEPLSKLDVTEPNLVAHGALITGLTSTDTPNFDAAFSRVVEDSAALSPELVGNVTYPSKLQAITTFSTPTGTRQRLLLFGGQYKSDATPDAAGVGVQRLFGTQSGMVLYAAPSATDFDPPTFGPVSVSSPTTSTVGFAVDVNDNSGVDGVKRVLALYRDASGSWKSIDLSHVAGNSRWSGAGPLTGTSVEWFIQAVDGSGNVGVTSNKADIKSATPPANTGAITATITGPQTASWFTGTASVALSGAPDITYSLDGAAFTPGTSLSVTGTGVHTLSFQGSDGSQGTATIPIDVTPPTISIQTGIIATGQAPQVVCADAGSGIASCVTTPATLDTSVGTHSVHVVATDRVGNVTQKDGSYTVDSFTGFFAPVDNPPTLNVAKAGSAIPVKFSLGLNAGLSIIQPGYPLVQAIACDTSVPQDAIDQTVTANASGLQYDATSNQYSYVWKTQSSWSGTCKQFVLRLTDGTQHIANFKFK
jgi:hypothetical protein